MPPSSFAHLVRTTPGMNFALSPVLTPAALLPTYVDGRWRKPALSAMQIARARRLVLASGQPWTLTEDTPEKRRDKPVKFKGHKAERIAHLKAAKVVQAMKEMPKRVEEYYRVQRSLRKHDTQYSRIIGEEEGEEKGKKKKAAAPAISRPSA